MITRWQKIVHRRAFTGAFASVLLSACAATPTASVPTGARVDADELLIVDCLLPGQVRRLGTRLTYLSPRRPVKTAASVCEIRGGEYAAYDRANFATALRIWLPQAEEGDPQAQTYVGEIYEKGLGTDADYALAAAWYRRAAEQGSARANINLGYLYEAGLGVGQDLTTAMNFYRQASGLTEGDLEYVSSVEYANREAAKVQTAQLQQQVGTLQQALEEAQARYGEGQSRYERTRADLIALREEVEAQRRRVSESGGAGAALAGGQRADGAESPGDVLGTENARLEEELRSASTLIAERESELQRLDRQLTEARRSDAVSREARAALAARLAAAGDELGQARQEQQRLTARLRDAELDASRERKADALIISGLEEELKRTETLLASARDGARRTRLQGQITEQQAALDNARAEQRRLTDRLLGEQLDARRRQRDAAQQLATLEQTLAEREVELARQSEELERLGSEVAGTRVRLATRDVERITPVLTLGPSIDIIDPPLLVTRGTPTLSASGRAALELIGRIDPPGSLLTFKINGAAHPLSPAGVFRYPVKPDDGALELLAVDEAGNSTRLELDLGERAVPSSVAAAGVEGTGTGNVAMADVADGTSVSRRDEGVPRGVDFGNYHALIVGNNDYRTLSDLNTATDDARSVERVLRERYGFETELLLDATRHDMLAALSRLRETLTAEDNLVIYYAGHGELDEVSRRGYWLPVDATLEDTDSWISNSAITDQIDALAAKHVMVVADSCYSGTLTRSSVAREPPDMSPELRARWFSAMAGSKVRTVLSSGGVRPVFDGAPGAEHSIFAQAFLDELDANGGVLEAYSLFVKVQQKVVASARTLQVEQSPQYSPIRHSGHEAGEFMFVAAPRPG